MALAIVANFMGWLGSARVGMIRNENTSSMPANWTEEVTTRPNRVKNRRLLVLAFLNNRAMGR